MNIFSAKKEHDSKIMPQGVKYIQTMQNSVCVRARARARVCVCVCEI
jgi:hypothetical protein